MADQSIVGVYDTMSEAEAAIRKLDEERFPVQHVSILAQNLESEKEVHGFITAGDVAKEGAGTGAWVGGLFGLLMGSAFLWVPGFGPLLVAGHLAGILLGTIEGAAFGAAGGGLLGWLAGLGISKQHILKYEDQMKAGKYLLVIRGDSAEIANAREILAGTNAVELTHHDEAGPSQVARA